MQPTPHIWLRAETAAHEHRTPLTPRDAALLVDRDAIVSVERSDLRVFGIEEYAEAGCHVVEAGSWMSAPADAHILGIKEPLGLHAPLHHRHVFFGHAYKGQADAPRVLRRFVEGDGVLLDLESLVDDSGHRVAAFGYWAGYVGATLAVLRFEGSLHAPLRHLSRAELDSSLLTASAGCPARVLVLGALGQAGRGACDAVETTGSRATKWDLRETEMLDVETILSHDILINAVATAAPGRPFLTDIDVQSPQRQLTTVADVTCDVTNAHNRLPFNDRTTTWETPFRQVSWPPPTRGTSRSGAGVVGVGIGM